MDKLMISKKAELVIESLINLKEPDRQIKEDNRQHGRTSGLIDRDFGIREWDWPQGVGLYGILKWMEVNQSDKYMNFLYNWYKDNFDRGLPSENVNTTAPFLTLAEVCDKWKEHEWEHVCMERAKWLMERLPRTEENLFQHVTSAIGDRDGVRLNDNQIWIDTIFMTVLFLNKMGYKYHNQAWKEEAEYQIRKHIEFLQNKDNGLFYHGYSFKRKDHFGGIFWCRGNSWFTNGILDYLNVSNDLETCVRHDIIHSYYAQVTELRKLQAPSGLWYTVLDDAESYEEVSGSAAITAGIIKGIRMGLLDREQWYPVVEKAIHAICSNIGSDGIVGQVSGGTGVGMSAADYKNVVITPMAYGQSLVLNALVEAMQL